MDGFGRHYKKMNDKLTLIFKGYFRNDKINGPGYYILGNGDIFEGEFENDLMKSGILLKSNG
jgi:hypothetical protein